MKAHHPYASASAYEAPAGQIEDKAEDEEESDKPARPSFFDDRRIYEGYQSTQQRQIDESRIRALADLTLVLTDANGRPREADRYFAPSLATLHAVKDCTEKVIGYEIRDGWVTIEAARAMVAKWDAEPVIAAA